MVLTLVVAAVFQEAPLRLHTQSSKTDKTTYLNEKRTEITSYSQNRVHS